MRLAPLGLVLLSTAGCGRAARDFDDICHAGARAGVASVADPAERAHRVAAWLQGNVRTSEARRTLDALAGLAGCEHKGALLREAAREAGYEGACPMADESERECRRAAPVALAQPPAAQDAGGEAEAQRIRGSAAPIRATTELLVIRGQALYGRVLPVYFSYSAQPEGFADEVARAGCPAPVAARFAATDHRAREFLAACGPHGARLLSRTTPDAEATVGRAALALVLEAAASDDLRASALHRALTAALLGPAHPH